MSSFPANFPQTITTSQMIAYSFVYRLMRFVLLSGPLLILLTPLILKSTFFLFDKMTGQHTVVAILMALAWSFVLSRWLPTIVRNAAPSPKQGERSASHIKKGSPILAFILSIGFCVWVLPPLESIFGFKLTGSMPILHFSSAVKVAIGAFLLGCSVCTRHIGPPSIVRCSSGPLSVNPATAALRTIFSSPEALLKFLTEPSIDPSKSNKPTPKTPPPRRLQRPTVAAAFTQIIISIAFSCAVAFISVLPIIHETRGDSALKKAVIIVCCVSTLANLFQTSLNGVKHEINPQLYRSQSGRNELKFKSIWDSTLQSILFLAVLVPIISMFVSTEWRDNLVCFGAAFCITFYLQFFDYSLKVFLCSTPDVQKVAEECLSDESPEAYLEVVLQSLCHSNFDLVKSLSNVSASAVWSDLEREEQKRNEASTTMMAQTLLYKTIIDERGPHLEEDVLRLAILTSLCRQREHVEIFKAPYIVPLCRGLCAYFGGIGEALILISAKKHELVGQWLLAPGTVVMTEYAVQVAASCLCSVISKNPTMWRNTRIATLVPTLLHSYCRLETGMLNYALSLDGMRATSLEEADKMNFFRTSCPQLLSLFSTLNNCCRVLLQRALEDSRRSAVFASCDQELLRWCEGKQYSIEISR